MLSQIRAAIIANGGTPTKFSPIYAMRELVAAYGGTPTQYTMIGLLREAVTASGGTPTKFDEIGLLRQLLTARGVSATSFDGKVLWGQVGSSGGGAAVPVLGTLTLSGTLTNGTASSGTISGATTASTITSNITGLSVNSGARTYSWDGTGAAGTTANGLVETLAGATGSPKNNSVTVAAAAAFALSQSVANADAPTGMTIGVLTGGEKGAVYSIASSSVASAVAISGSELTTGSAAPTTPATVNVTVNKVFGGVTQSATYALTMGQLSTIADTFAGTAGTLLNGRSTTTGSKVWTATPSANWQLTGSGAAFCSSNTAGNKAVFDSGLSDYVVSTLISSWSSSNSICVLGGLIFRYQDANNYWKLELDSRPGSGCVVLYKMVAGVLKTMATYKNFVSSGVAQRVTIRTDGKYITGWCDGVEMYTVMDTAFQTATLMGIMIGSAGSTGSNRAYFSPLTVQPTMGLKLDFPSFTAVSTTTPVIARGAAGAYDQTDCNNPNVVRDPVNNRWILYYSGYNSANARGTNYQDMCVAYSSSLDGPWTKEAANPVYVSDTTDGIYSINGGLFYNTTLGKWIHVYQVGQPAASHIHLMTATDITGPWTRIGTVIPTGGWKASVFDASLRQLSDGTYEMWFCGSSGGNKQFGRATSPDGITWTEDFGPIIAAQTTTTGNRFGFDAGEPNAIYPYAITDGSQQIVHFDGVAADLGAVHSRSIHQAVSLDWGVTWHYRINAYGPSGAGFMSNQVFDSFVYDDGTAWRMWHSGAPLAGAALGMDTSIGVATGPRFANLLRA